jgi:hypothetical protein
MLRKGIEGDENSKIEYGGVDDLQVLPTASLGEIA